MTADLLREVYAIDATATGDVVVAEGRRYELDVRAGCRGEHVWSITRGDRVWGGVFACPEEVADQIYAMARGHASLERWQKWWKGEDGQRVRDARERYSKERR